MDLQIILIATFVAATSIVFIVAQVVWREDEREASRLNSLSSRAGQSSMAPHGRQIEGLSQSIHRRLPGLAARLMPETDTDNRRLQSRLLHAGIYSPSALGVFLVAKLVLMVVPPVACFIAGQMGLIETRMVILYGAAGGALGMLLPGIWLDKRKANRHALLNRSLPDFLDLMVACVESGLSLSAALQRVTDELQTAHPVLAGELAVVQRQVQLGATLESALFNLAERTDLESLHGLTTMIQQSQKFGASIADALRTHADILRTEREQVAEELAQKAAVKILFPTLLLIFPATFVVLAGPAVIQLNEKFSAKAESQSRVK